VPGATKIEFLAASGVTRFDQLFLHVAGGNTQVEFNGQAVLVFGAVLTQADILFG
jgi:hypothetical protein